MRLSWARGRNLRSGRRRTRGQTPQRPKVNPPESGPADDGAILDLTLRNGFVWDGGWRPAGIAGRAPSGCQRIAASAG